MISYIKENLLPIDSLSKVKVLISCVNSYNGRYTSNLHHTIMGFVKNIEYKKYFIQHLTKTPESNIEAKRHDLDSAIKNKLIKLNFERRRGLLINKILDCGIINEVEKERLLKRANKANLKTINQVEGDFKSLKRNKQKKSNETINEEVKKRRQIRNQNMKSASNLVIGPFEYTSHSIHKSKLIYIPTGGMNKKY